MPSWQSVATHDAMGVDAVAVSRGVPAMHPTATYDGREVPKDDVGTTEDLFEEVSEIDVDSADSEDLFQDRTWEMTVVLFLGVGLAAGTSRYLRFRGWVCRCP